MDITAQQIVSVSSLVLALGLGIILASITFSKPSRPGVVIVILALVFALLFGSRALLKHLDEQESAATEISGQPLDNSSPPHKE